MTKRKRKSKIKHIEKIPSRIDLNSRGRVSEEESTAGTISSVSSTDTSRNGVGGICVRSSTVLAVVVVVVAAVFPWSSSFLETSSTTTSLPDINHVAYLKELSNSKSGNPMETFLSCYICNHTNGYCHPSLVPVPERRTHAIATPHGGKATYSSSSSSSDRIIAPNATLLIVPRDRLLLDIDAIRDPWIHKYLFLPAQRLQPQLHIDLGAYLAVYLVLRQRGQQQRLLLQDCQHCHHDHDPMEPYFFILPTYEQLQQRHPAMWSNQLLLQLLNQTSALRIARAIRNMIETEYGIFQNLFSSSTTTSTTNATASTKTHFAKHILPKQDYIAARINVMARSFGTGPITNVENEPKKEYYKRDYNEGWKQYCCRAMVPILDMWDHHPQAPTQWEYSKVHQAFIVTAKPNTNLEWAGSDIWVTYGTYTDSHLFAKFGFINVDGSGWTEASIAAFHNVAHVGLLGATTAFSTSRSHHEAIYNDVHLAQQMNQYLHYQYDVYPPPSNYAMSTPLDYSSIPTADLNNTSSASRIFQQYKLQILTHIRDDYHRWNFQMQPRDHLAHPGKSSRLTQLKAIPNFYSGSGNNVRFDGKHIIATCRLIALSEDDYEGKALETLEYYYNLIMDSTINDPKNSSSLNEYFVHPQDEHLEYRALSCLHRLVTIRLSQYPSTIMEDIIKLKSATTLHVREQWSILVNLGEKQSLEALQQIVLDGMNKKKQYLSLPRYGGIKKINNA